MADANNPARSKMEQLLGQMDQILTDGLDGPAKRAHAKKMLTEAAGYIKSNQLDEYAERRPIRDVRELRAIADEIPDFLKRLGADDNEAGFTRQSRDLADMAERLLVAAGGSHDALPRRVQQPRGGRKTRKGKGKSRKASRRARHSRRR